MWAIIKCKCHFLVVDASLDRLFQSSRLQIGSFSMTLPATEIICIAIVHRKPTISKSKLKKNTCYNNKMCHSLDLRNLVHKVHLRQPIHLQALSHYFQKFVL
eukprot:NODE_56_length_28873_cov_1.243101.p22 type:complete len:102 gc:universal NODE_56_length_28873_cov_1.243101:2594-2289(-)